MNSEANKKYITIVDLETSGLDSSVHEILQLAAARLSFIPGHDWKSSLRVESRISYLTIPEIPYVDPVVAQINGYNVDKWAREGVRLPKALAELFPLLNGAYWAGSKPSFDFDFIASATKRLHWQMPRLASHHPIDLTSAFVNLLFQGQIPKLGQSALMDVFLETQQTHHADDDVNGLINLVKCL